MDADSWERRFDRLAALAFGCGAKAHEIDVIAGSTSERASSWLGKRVRVADGRGGDVRFVGRTEFAQATRCLGVELVAPFGGHDGTVDGVRYFRCPPGCGLMVDPSEVVIAMEESMELDESESDGGSPPPEGSALMLALPPELLVQVLSHLPPHALATAARVCTSLGLARAARRRPRRWWSKRSACRRPHARPWCGERVPPAPLSV